MKKLLQGLLLALMFGTGAMAYAIAETDYSDLEIEEIEAERYEAVDKKWEVEVEYENDMEKKFYVYNIDDEAELISEIADVLNVSDSEVSDIIEIDEDDEDELEEDENEDEELEIEAERYENIDGKWEVEYEKGDSEKKFYVYEIDDEAELISEIADYLNLTEDEVSEVIEIKDDFENEDEDEDEEEKDKEVKTTNETALANMAARDARILALQEQLAELITLVIKLLNAQLAS